MATQTDRGGRLRARAVWQFGEPIHAITYFTRETRAATDALGLKGGWMSYFGCPRRRSARAGTGRRRALLQLPPADGCSCHARCVDTRRTGDAARSTTLCNRRRDACGRDQVHSFALRELHYPYRAPRERRETVRVRPEGPPISSTFSSTATPSRVTPSDASARAAGPSSWSRRPSSK